jgi:hypothetical protein
VCRKSPDWRRVRLLLELERRGSVRSNESAGLEPGDDVVDHAGVDQGGVRELPSGGEEDSSDCGLVERAQLPKIVEDNKDRAKRTVHSAIFLP